MLFVLSIGLYSLDKAPRVIVFMQILSYSAFPTTVA